jgi:hypothetical protein
MSTITIDDDLLNQVIETSHYQNAQDAVIKILSDYVRQKSDERINVQACVAAFEKIEKGDRSGLTVIGDIDDYIEKLKNEINQD